ncbi:hypothetical protein NQ318_020490 [Aromia moschata]|uniref:Uncharacterized protein n=1 Tax=Aromia moschata TaxID=1265417 RepID=A0AAV8YCB5_9CUCU|nr:hypothetical protein NQ318_020490 [Aromia moschata]
MTQTPPRDSSISDIDVPLVAVGEPTGSDPDPFGLVSRSITLRLPLDRKLARGDSLEIRCESALPGVPLPPQVTTLAVPLRSSAGPQVIHNQELHWYSGYSVAAARLGPLPACLVAAAAAAARWSIGALLQ